MIVVADTSPLRYLILIEHDHILPALYGRVLVPPAVIIQSGLRPEPRLGRSRGPLRLRLRADSSALRRDLAVACRLTLATSGGGPLRSLPPHDAENASWGPGSRARLWRAYSLSREQIPDIVRQSRGGSQAVPSGHALVDVSGDRVIRRVAGLRPFRRTGFRVEAQRFGDRTVIHNYGHGGGGVSLSWGSAHLALPLAMGTAERRFAVLGAGAVGLATARLLQDHGAEQVTIYARDPAAGDDLEHRRGTVGAVFHRGGGRAGTRHGRCRAVPRPSWPIVLPLLVMYSRRWNIDRLTIGRVRSDSGGHIVAKIITSRSRGCGEHFCHG